MFTTCPICKTADLTEPIADCSSKYLLCERCADDMAIELKQMAMQNLRELGAALMGRP